MSWSLFSQCMNTNWFFQRALYLKKKTKVESLTIYLLWDWPLLRIQNMSDISIKNNNCLVNYEKSAHAEDLVFFYIQKTREALLQITHFADKSGFLRGKHMVG